MGKAITKEEIAEKLGNLKRVARTLATSSIFDMKKQAKQALFELGEVHKELFALLYDFLENFELHLEAIGVKGKTIHNYERIITRFFRFIKDEKKQEKGYWVCISK